MMRISRLSAFALAAAILAGNAEAQTQDYIQDALCVDGSNTLCSNIPVDMPNLNVRLGYNPNTNAGAPGDFVRQPNFDYFAWQMFVALNWPLGPDGQPSTTSTINSDVTSMRVWESFLKIGQVYPGSVPPSKCDTSGIRLVLSSITKFSNATFTEPFTPYPLIDRAGNYVVYDIRINGIEAEYIRSNGLQTKAGQQAFGRPWDLPRGLGNTPGAMELKTSWRVFNSGDDTTGYFTLPGVVEVFGSNTASGEHMCFDVTLGLIGMHIMQKITNPTNFSDFWVWGTFEHVDNAPLAEGATPSAVNDKAKATGHYPLASCPAPDNAGDTWTFFNPGCQVGGQACAPNMPPSPLGSKYLWESQPPYAAPYLTSGQFGTQVTRCWDIYDTAKTINTQFQTALAPSNVWNKYQLVGAQWAQSGSEGAPSIAPFSAPFYLTNTTLETYLQIDPIGIDPYLGHSPGSCIACHNFATDTAGNKSDFSFLSGNAQ